VAHFRRWSGAGWNWLVRVKEGGRIRVGNQERKQVKWIDAPLSAIREVRVKERPAYQWVASCDVGGVKKSQAKRAEANGKRPAPQAGERWRSA